MSEIKVKAGREENSAVVTINYEIPNTSKALVDKYGEEIVVNLCDRALTLAVQALVRAKMSAGETNQKVLQAAVDNWVPGVRTPGVKKSPLERATSAISQLDPDALAELLAKVKAAQKARSA